MPRPAAPRVTSAIALETSAIPSAPRLISGALGDAASGDALTRLNAAVRELKALAVEPMLQQAVTALRREDHRTACDWALKALQQDERSGFGWYLLGIARERAGDFASSVAAYESALRLLPDHAEIANDLGRLAYRLGMQPQAEKLFRIFLARYPDHPEGANNLACAIRDQKRADEAIAILRPAIEKSPEVPMLWNTMGTIVAEQGDYPNAVIFFEEALRLDPNFAKARYNLGNSKLILGDPEGALEACEAAMRLPMPPDERQMMHLARSTILIALGRIGEGWDEYEARIHPDFHDVTHFLVDRPRWTPGADIAGKSLLVIGEQGLGDEILFANTLPDVVDKLGPEGRLTIAVEPRLIPLFQRSFPRASVGPHATYQMGARLARLAPDVADLSTVDLWTPIASLLREYRRGLADFPKRGRYLVADPARVAHWREVLDHAPPGPKIGLLWKSAVTRDARHRYFAPFAQWAPVITQPGAVFVNLQYGDCAEEVEAARREFGVEIWQPPGIDLKQDLDDVAALSCALDLVIGFSNATLNIAAACGAPTFLVALSGAWTRLGLKTEYAWYPQVRVFEPPSFADWPAVMDQLGRAFGEFLAARGR